MLLEWPALQSRLEGNVLRVTGVVQPSPITRRYVVQVEYRELGVPRAAVLRPALSRRIEAPDVPIPHTYGFNTPGSERPCLYYPKGREWTASMSIAMTIMPWLLGWLVDYEVWLGGGVSHGEGEKSEQGQDAA